MEIKKIHILGMPVHLANTETAVAYLNEQMNSGIKQFVIAQNPEKIMKSHQDEELKQIIQEKATLLIADGVGLVIAAKLKRLPRITRVTGVGLFEEMLEMANKEQKRIFLYGAKNEVVTKAGQIIQDKYPNLTLTGTQDGYERDNDKIIARIDEAKPDYVFVALGSPGQEKWIANHLDRLNVQLVMGVGGSFDVLTGNVKRAPKWMQKIGMEWFHRLLKQPTRAKRMLNLPKFLWQIIKSR